MTNATKTSTAGASPSKRKRAEVPAFDGSELSDVESCDVENPVARYKKLRLIKTESLDGSSSYDGDSTPSLAGTATATLADTETPFTDISSLRSKSKPRPKVYRCHFQGCDKSFDRPIRLQAHINSHTGERPHACPQTGCDKRFFKAEHLKQHIHDKHTEYDGFECTHPVHDDVKGGTTPCGKTFPTSSKLKRHMALHEQKEETTCTYADCGKVFRKQETLQRHIKKDHLGEQPYECFEIGADGAVCGQTFPTPGQLRGHKAHTHEAPKYSCDICASAMATEGDGTENSTEWRAPGFPSVPDAQDLSDDLADGIVRTINWHDVAATAAPAPAFATHAELQAHMKALHPPTCVLCGKRCRSNRDLKAHVEIHHPEPSSSNSNSNNASEPREAKRFLCSYDGCARAQEGNGFSRRGNLDVHVKAVHSKERKFTCGEYDMRGHVHKLAGWNGLGCGLALGTKQSLIAHIRTQHLGVPAAVGARTGLRDEDRKRVVRTTRKKQKEEEEEDPDAADVDAMDVDCAGGPDGTAAANNNRAISMLTGDGYEQIRPVACLLAASQGCKLRFANSYQLAYHLEMSHQWNVDDINDAIAAEEPSSDQDLGNRLRWEMDVMEDHQHFDAALDPQLHAIAM